jgi:spore coat polysaccharide biosynthesis predicted glycosyltransferase SpsG
LEAAGNPPVYPDKQQLLLAFGGGDKYNLALEYSKIITTIDPDIELNVISGVASGTYENMRRWSESAQLETRVRTFTNQSAGELVSLLTRSSGCILPSSGMMYEALALRRPLITGYFVPNQMKIARDIINDAGGIFYLGDLNNPDHSLLKKILDRIKRINIREVINYQSGIIDGKSNERLIHEFKKLK